MWRVCAIALSFVSGWRAYLSMLVFPRRLVVGDVSVIHPAAATCAGGAARTPGYVAAVRDVRRAYRKVFSALPFVFVSVESFGASGLRP
jgi:hypothetical protein